MPVGDIYEVEMRYNTPGSVCRAVFHYSYELTAIPFGGTLSQLLAEKFAAQKASAILAPCGVNVGVTSILARNLFDPTDFYENFATNSGSQGTSSSEYLPPFVAFGFQYSGDRRDVRQGSKRLAGVLETNSIAGYASGALTSALDAARLAMRSPVTAGDVIPANTWFPVIVKRVKETDPTGNVIYRLPENTGETVIAHVLDVFYKMLLTSQVSRKIGRGV